MASGEETSTNNEGSYKSAHTTLISAWSLFFVYIFSRVYQRHSKRLNRFHTGCLRKLLKIKWQDRIQNTVLSPEKGRDAKCRYSSEIGTVKMDRSYHQNA